MKNTLSLNGKWSLRFYPEQGKTPETPEELRCLSLPAIDADVPGNVELDLMAAGLASALRRRGGLLQP